MNPQYFFGLILLVVGAVATARNNSTRTTIANQTAAIEALQATQDLHETKIAALEGENSALKSRVATLQTLPLEKIEQHMETMVKALAVLTEGQTQIMAIYNREAKS